MKSLFKGIFLISAALIIAGCAKETDLTPINERITSIEERVNALEASLIKANSDIKTLQELVEYRLVNSAVKKNGVWTIVLSNGTELNIAAGGEDRGNTPIIKVDAEGFWVVDNLDGNGYVYVLDSNGQKVKASAGAPVLGVDDQGYWTLTVDGVTTQIKNKNGEPILAEPKSIFSDAKVEGNNLVLTLANGEVISVPIVAEFLVKIDGIEEEQIFELGETKTYNVTMMGIQSAIVSKPDGWRVVLDDTSLKVTAPAAVTKAVSFDSESQVAIYAVSIQGYSTIAAFEVSVDNRNMYEKFLDGKDITIAGRKYNKADYKGTVVHVTADQSILAAPGIYFIDGGKTLTFNGGNYNASTLVVGIDSGNKGKVVFNIPSFNMGTESAEHNTYAFQNVEISSIGDHFLHVGSSAIGNIVFDNCFINMNAVFVNRTNTAMTLNRLTIVNSNVKVTADNQSFLYTHACAGVPFGTITVRNNVFWSPDGTIKNLYFTDAPYANGADIDNIIFENNTFFDIATNGTGVNRAFFGFNTIGNSISVKSNLYYTTTDAVSDSSKGSVMVIYTKGMPSDDTWAKASANNVNSLTNFSWNCAVYGSDSKRLWYHGIVRDQSIKPFGTNNENFNLTTGKFTIAPEFAAYGAQR